MFLILSKDKKFMSANPAVTNTTMNVTSCPGNKISYTIPKILKQDPKNINLCR